MTSTHVCNGPYHYETRMYICVSRWLYRRMPDAMQCGPCITPFMGNSVCACGVSHRSMRIKGTTSSCSLLDGTIPGTGRYRISWSFEGGFPASATSGSAPLSALDCSPAPNSRPCRTHRPVSANVSAACMQCKVVGCSAMSGAEIAYRRHSLYLYIYVRYRDLMLELCVDISGSRQ